MANHNKKPKSEPPFIKVTHPDGTASWEMTDRLKRIHADLAQRMRRIENISDKDQQAAFIALEMMQHRAMRLISGGEEISAIHEDDYFSDDKLQPEEVRHVVRFMIPLALALTMPRPEGGNDDDQTWQWLPQTKAEAEKLREDALNWVDKVICWRFSEFLKVPKKEVRRAFDLIQSGLEYCREFDALPSRAELVRWLLDKGREEFDIQNPTGLSEMWRFSGLQGLAKAKPGPNVGRKSKAGKFGHLPGVSYD